MGLPDDFSDSEQDVHPPTAHRVRKGDASPNRGPNGFSRADRQKMRAIGDLARELHKPEEILEALWSVASGVDPFASKRARAKNPDNLPAFGSTEIDWTHRTAALKLYAEYAMGKPLQGVVVDAQVQQQIALEGRVDTGPVDFRSMPPEVRAALRMAAAAVLGKPLPPGVIDAVGRERPGQPRQLAGQGRPQPGERLAWQQAPAARAVDELPVEVGALEGGPVRVRDAEVERGQVEALVHDPMVRSDVSDVKEIHLEFRESSNLVDATLTIGGPLAVRFRANDGGPLGRLYRYANVTPEMMRAWKDAVSAGAWFAREIRGKAKTHPVLPDPVRSPGIVL